MCGIVGVVHRDPARPVREDIVRTMCAAIRSRGPDDEGRHVQGHVGLGIRRLSIIDLAGGHQPIYNEDRSAVIVFNGEIYNYHGLRDGLMARGHRFGSSGDTETILHLYEERGRDCVRDLRGMFAFAIWDEKKRELLLARDRFGIKPLYIATAPWGIAFASELKALVAAGVTSRRLDWDALDAFLQLGYIPAPLSPFSDVRKLEAGHTLTWRQTGEVSIERYWEYPVERRPAPRDVKHQVLEWLDDSVAAHLVSDVPVAAFLSGGLDSSAVVASMALQDGTPHAYTARYGGTGSAAADETGLARLVADRYGARLTIVDVQPDVTEILEPIIRALDEPHADDSAIPTWLISEAVARDYKVALTGIGGDELFGGYRRHLGLLVGQYYSALPAGLRHLASSLASRMREPEGNALGVDRLKRFLRSGEADVPSRFLGYLSRMPDSLRAGLYAPAIRAEAHPETALVRFRELFAQGGSPGGLNAGLFLDAKAFLADDILALSDRLSMAHSLEIRVPFVDHVLVEHIHPLPDFTKIGLGKPKHLLRRALQSRLPAPLLNAPKRGFVGPTATWLRNELRPLLTDELSAGRVGRLGYFDPTAVNRLLDEHFDRRQNREGILWALLCFSTWHRLYVESPATETYAAA